MATRRIGTSGPLAFEQAHPLGVSTEQPSNPKGLLQEMCVDAGFQPPGYETYPVPGHPPHVPLFSCRVVARVPSPVVCVSQGGTKKIAERTASSLMIHKLRETVPCFSCPPRRALGDIEDIAPRVPEWISQHYQHLPDSVLAAWVRNLCADGDVEPNPGPLAAFWLLTLCCVALAQIDRPYYVLSNAAAATQVNVVLVTGTGTEVVSSFSISGAGYNSATTAAVFGVQVVPNAGSAAALPTVTGLASSQFRWIGAWIGDGASGRSPQFDQTYSFSPVTLAAGDTLVFSILPSAASTRVALGVTPHTASSTSSVVSVSNFPASQNVVVTSLPEPVEVEISDSLNVSVVSFDLDYPVWVTDQRTTEVGLPGVVEAEARERNRKMHALNGNTSSFDVIMRRQSYIESDSLCGAEEDDYDAWMDAQLAARFGVMPTDAAAPGPRPSTPPLRVHHKPGIVVKRGAEREALIAACGDHTALQFAVRRALGDLLEFDGLFTNFYAPLSLDDADEPVDPDPRELADAVTRAASTAKPKSQASGKRVERPSPDTKRPTVQEPDPKAKVSKKQLLDPQQRMIQRQAVTDRVVAKLKSGPAGTVIAWLERSKPSRSWAYTVLTSLWGQNWQATQSVDAWYASWRLSAHDGASPPGSAPALLELMGYCQLHKALSSLGENATFQAWFEAEFAVSWADSTKVFSAEADAHNREMHSLNGNPDFSGDMKEVREAPSVQALYNVPLSDTTPKPWVTALEVSTVPSSINPVDMDVPTSMPLRGDVVTAANAVVNNQQLQPLESVLAPREVRNGVAAALIASTNRLAVFTHGPMSYQSSKLADSDLIKSIVEAAIKANQNLGRADNTTLGGFQAFDVAFVGRIKSYYGLSMQSALMKLVSLMLIKNLAQSRSQLPLSCEPGLFDPYTQLNPANALALSYNDSAVFGEDCGGATAELPFRGGATGTVYFHQTLQTVPENQRALAIFLPANLLLADQTAGMAIALFVMMWADFPTVMWTVTVPTLDTAGGNADDQTFVPHLSTSFIPGLTEIHVILPRRTTVANPTTQGQANTNVIVRPVTGSTASTGLAANTPLDVNFVGGALQGYNLAEFCYTWSDDFDSTDVAQFLQRMNDLVDIQNELKHAFEKVATAGVRYPPLVSQALAATAKLAVNSAAGWAQISPLGIRASNTVADFPQATINRPDLLCFDTDIVAWNKTVLTVATVDGRPPNGEPLTPMMASPQALYWEKLLARMLAVTTNVHVANLGWSAETWDTAYANTDMRSFRMLARAHYAGAAAGSLRPQPAQLGPSLARLFTALLGFSPSRDLDGNTVFDYMAAPLVTRNTVFSTAGAALGNCVPVFLPDVWIHQTARTVPRALKSYPPQNNQDSTTGLITDDYRTVISGGGTAYGPMLRGSTPKNALRQVDTRDDTDEEIWNARLVVVLGVAVTMRDMANNVIANSPAAANFPKAQFVTADYTVPGLSTGLRAASTFWLPRTLSDGRLQFPMDSRANMIATSRVETGIQRAAIEIWAINGLLPSGDYKLGGDGPGQSFYLDLLRKEPVDLSQGGAQPEADPATTSGGSPPSTSM